MSTPTEEAAQQAAQQMAALIRALVELTRALEGARRGQPAARAVPPPQPAERYAAAIERTFGPQVRRALTDSPEWGRMVEQLAHLERAGIAPEQLFGTLATITRQTLPQPTAAAPAAEQQKDMTALVFRHTNPAVAQALTASPEWPRIASQLEDLKQSGFDVGHLLEVAPPELTRLVGTIDTAWQRDAGNTAQQQVTTPAPAADRQTALAQAGISQHENERLVRAAREAAPPGIGERLAASTRWPEVAQAMQALEQRGIDPGARLADMRRELTAQAATGPRTDVTAAALSALERPAVAAPGASRVRGSAAVRVRTEPDANLRQAAELAATNLGVSSGMLLAQGHSTKETGRLLTELEHYGIVGPRSASGMHPARVSSVTEAHTTLDRGTQRELTAAAAAATSTTSAGPPRASGPTPAAATAVGTPTRTTARRR